VLVLGDKLNHLKRQKEILEEKIMEQFRRIENYSSSSNDGLSLKKNAKSTIGAIFGKKGRRTSSVSFQKYKLFCNFYIGCFICFNSIYQGVN
jgi:hypothetical protein